MRSLSFRDPEQFSWLHSFWVVRLTSKDGESIADGDTPDQVVGISRQSRQSKQLGPSKEVA